MSRRRFIGTSIATGLAGIVPWGATPRETGTLGIDVGARKLTLRVTGNSSDGYGVTVLCGGNPVARHNGGGEFFAVFQIKNEVLRTAPNTGGPVRGRVTRRVQLCTASASYPVVPSRLCLELIRVAGTGDGRDPQTSGGSRREAEVAPEFRSPETFVP